MADQKMNSNGKNLLTFGELSAFCQQISMILKSGIPLHEGLSLLKEDVADAGLRSVLTIVSDEVSSGKPLPDALDAASSFPNYMVNMIRIGSDAGKLDDVTASLADYYDREDMLRQNIKSSVVYPLTLTLMMLVVMMVFSIKVLPIFDQVFRGLGTTMSPAAQAIMNVGMAASKYSIALLILAALILVGVVFFFKSQRGSAWLTRFSSTGKLSEKISMARFSSSMSLMLASGLDTEHSLQMTKSVIANQEVRGKVDRCLELIASGTPFVEAVGMVGLYPRMTLRMLSLGFQAGNLDTVMHAIADSAEEEIDATLMRRVALIEPVSVAFLSLIIGVILISVMLPLMSIMSSIG